jgi:hypothetical protein
MSFGPEQSLKRQADLHRRELNGEDVSVKLSDGEIRAIEDKVKALEKIFSERIIAKFKLEIQFGKNRTSSGQPFAGVVTMWLSGTKLNGGGDEKVYECPNPRCGQLILPHQIDNNRSICPHCGNIWKSEDTIGERFFKLTDQNWAHAVLQMFSKVDMNADIYLKYHPTDIRYQTAMELARDRGGEEVAKARKNRGLFIYPLANIIRDTKNGSDLYKRIRIFINA